MRTQIEAKENELGYNKSRMFKRAHFLVRTTFMSFSQALKQVWKECKEYRKELREEIEALYSRLRNAYCPQYSEAMQVAEHNEMMYKLTTRNN